MSILVRIGWLTAVWVLLWGSVTPVTVLGGIAVAAGVTAVARLPRVVDPLAVRPLRLLMLAGHLLCDLVVSSVEVSWHTLRHGPAARACVLEMPLPTGSDRVTVAIANAMSLAPGTMALDFDLDGRRWYLYVLGPRTPADVERARRRALALQQRVVATLDPEVRS
ncbi:Na+/H+ antiporter subunit E [Pseudonocardia sp.]|uniref:Na+/H+ antiporter subunit E n=1 Tax=Pseudonocardia sp. TaxID=60912 RepID=UPI003D0F6F20